MTRTRSLFSALAAAVAMTMGLPPAGFAQRHGHVVLDSSSRLTRLKRDLAYGAAEGLGYAAVDQMRNAPAEWGDGWSGYSTRAGSDIAEFVIQESVTAGLAAAMNRPVTYTPCRCGSTSRRVSWAVRGAVTDQMPDGTHPIAVPRIVGAFAGSFAQAAWRPAGSISRTNRALLNGVTSLGVGALINPYYEFRH